MTNISLFRRILNWMTPALKLNAHDHAALNAHRNTWLGLGVQYQTQCPVQRTYSY